MSTMPILNRNNRKRKKSSRVLSLAIFVTMIGALVIMMVGVTLLIHYRLSRETAMLPGILPVRVDENKDSLRIGSLSSRRQRIIKGSKSVTSQQFLTKSIFNKDAPKVGQVVKVNKKGKVVHKEIRSVTLDDLKGLNLKLPENINDITMEEAVKGREMFVDTLHDAGVDEIDVGAVLALPKWSEVTKLYGENGPVVIGLDSCERYRNTVSKEQASIA